MVKLSYAGIILYKFKNWSHYNVIIEFLIYFEEGVYFKVFTLWPRGHLAAWPQINYYYYHVAKVTHNLREFLKLVLTSFAQNSS